MFIARPTLNNARSIGAQCRHQLYFAPNGANHLCGGRAINMLLLRSKDPSANYVTALPKGWAIQDLRWSVTGTLEGL
jgi:hypothetical protein